MKGNKLGKLLRPVLPAVLAAMVLTGCGTGDRSPEPLTVSNGENFIDAV